jgi:hypothetical protein
MCGSFLSICHRLFSFCDYVYVPAFVFVTAVNSLLQHHQFSMMVQRLLLSNVSLNISLSVSACVILHSKQNLIKINLSEVFQCTQFLTLLLNVTIVASASILHGLCVGIFVNDMDVCMHMHVCTRARTHTHLPYTPIHTLTLTEAWIHIQEQWHVMLTSEWHSKYLQLCCSVLTHHITTVMP